MPRALLVLVALAVTCTGCVSVKDTPLDQRAIPKITGQDVVVVKRPLPDFSAMTAGKISAGALFGPLGGAVAGAAMISAGNELVKEHAVDDPAYAIAEELARSLAARYGIRSVGVGTGVVSDNDASSVAATYKTAPLALDVKTLHWGFMYFSSNWARYRVVYRARMRLISTTTADVIAEGGCASYPEKSDEAPTYDELLGNGASRLKAELAKAAQFCTREFLTKYPGS